VAKSAPDGYTLLLSDVGALAINPSVYPNIPYDVVKDFSPVGMVSYSPHAFGVHPSVPVNNVKELIDYAKANPGKLNFAISGTGGAPHLAGIAFAQRTGINWAYIPYKGGSQAVADVASGQANVIMNGMLATYPTMKSGRIRALAISSAQRVGSAPEVPTIAETLPGFETGSYQGLLAPAGTPRDVVSKLNAEVAKILATPEVKVQAVDATGTQFSFEGQLQNLPIVAPAAYESEMAHELVERRINELTAATLQLQIREAALAGDWLHVEQLLNRLETIGRNEPWIAASIAFTRQLMSERDERRMSKEMLYKSRKMNNRLSSTDEVMFSMQSDIEEQAFLRRKSNEGRRSET
jgi:hypothetical protein